MGRVMPDLLYLLRTMPVARMATILSSHDYYAGSRPFKQFGGDEARYKLAAATLLTLPGRPFIYYGEEIGLAHSQPVDYQDQSIRGPMSWSGEPNAGFTTAETGFRPLVENWRSHNVAAQQARPDSLLNWYRALIAFRNAHPALQTGSFEVISRDDDPVFAFIREAAGERLLVLINYASREAELEMPAAIQSAAWSAVFPVEPTQRSGQPAASSQRIKIAPLSVAVFSAAN